MWRYEILRFVSWASLWHSKWWREYQIFLSLTISSSPSLPPTSPFNCTLCRKQKHEWILTSSALQWAISITSMENSDGVRCTFYQHSWSSIVTWFIVLKLCNPMWVLKITSQMVNDHNCKSTLRISPVQKLSIGLNNSIVEMSKSVPLKTTQVFSHILFSMVWVFIWL